MHIAQARLTFGLIIGLLSACTGSNRTTGKRVIFETSATTDQTELTSGFDTSLGWHVTLTQGAVAFESFYYFDGEPAFVRNGVPRARPAVPSPVDQVLQFLGEGVAHAHPGHYQAGNGLGQMLTPGSVDLFAEFTSLGAGSGVTGTYRSARFRFADEAVGAEAKTLGDHVAMVQGVATRLTAPEDAGDAGGASPKVVHFLMFADYADVTKNVTNGEVDGCQFEEADVQSDGTITLTFKPSVWFDLVDFKDVDPGSAEHPTEVEHGSLAHQGFALGLVQLTAYHFDFRMNIRVPR